jgi:hypothetical protein
LGEKTPSIQSKGNAVVINVSKKAGVKIGGFKAAQYQALKAGNNPQNINAAYNKYFDTNFTPPLNDMLRALNILSTAVQKKQASNLNSIRLSLSKSGVSEAKRIGIPLI